MLLYKNNIHIRHCYKKDIGAREECICPSHSLTISKNKLLKNPYM